MKDRTSLHARRKKKRFDGFISNQKRHLQGWRVSLPQSLVLERKMCINYPPESLIWEDVSSQKIYNTCLGRMVSVPPGTKLDEQRNTVVGNIYCAPTCNRKFSAD